MKIAYIVSLFPKLSETFILREMEALRRRGHEILVVSLKRQREPVRHAEADAFLASLIHAPSPVASLGAWVGYRARRPSAALQVGFRTLAAHGAHPLPLAKALPLVPVGAALARRLAAERVEHVHAHWATYPAQVAWAVHHLEGIPYSITAHAHDIFLPNPMLGVKIRDSLFTATISEFNREWIVKSCGREAAARLQVVRCGVPLEQFPFRPPGGAAGPVVSVGRLVDYKGFATLIDAMGLLRERGRDLSCRIVGDGPLMGRLRDRIRTRGLEGRVELMGARSQEEVRELLSRAGLCVLASQRGGDGQMDGIPVVLMEALALGVPSVSTRISGIPELIEDGVTGLLAPPADPRALASAMERVLDDPELAGRLAAGGRRRVEKDYDLEVNAGRLLDLIRRRPEEPA